MRARALALLLLACAATARRDPLPDMRGSRTETRELPGWEGEQQRSTDGVGTDDTAPRTTFLSWSPRIILVERFLSVAEANHIIELARCVPRQRAAAR
jgi:hypothetical protein